MRAIAVGISGNVSLATGAPVDVAETMGVPLAAREDLAGAVRR
jgi:hypothetical protein